VKLGINKKVSGIKNRKISLESALKVAVESIVQKTESSIKIYNAIGKAED
jgi:hypothetical protein